VRRVRYGGWSYEGVYLSLKNSEEVLHRTGYRRSTFILSNLRTALAARNLRQVDLAIHTLKISLSVLSEIIRGRRKASAELCRKITEVLQADEVWLVKPAVKIPVAGRKRWTQSHRISFRVARRSRTEVVTLGHRPALR